MKAGDRFTLHIDATLGNVMSVTVVEVLEPLLPEPVKAGDEIATHANADELPPCTAIRTWAGTLYEKRNGRGWITPGDQGFYLSADLIYPITVLYVPDPS